MCLCLSGEVEASFGGGEGPCLPFFPDPIQLLLFTVTPGESSKTWGRNSVVPKEEGEEEEKRAPKKKGRTWGPSTLGQKELASGDEG